MTLEGLHQDFRDLLVLLADGGVEFLVVGGSPENAARLFAALARFGAPREAAA